MVLFCTFLLKTEYINSVFCSAPVFSAPDSTAHVGRMGLGDNPTRNIVHSSHHQVYCPERGSDAELMTVESVNAMAKAEHKDTVP